MAQAMIFADAGAFIARHRSSDTCHRAALKAWRDLEHKRRPLFTSSLVLTEAAQFLRRISSARQAAQSVRDWLNSDELVVMRPDREIELEAADLLEKYADQKISFTDCVSFVLMRRRRIDTVFGFDRHFRVAGFNLWPEATI